MNKETLERAIELKNRIKSLEDGLCDVKYGYEFLRVGIYSCMISFPEEMNNDIRLLIQKYIDIYKRELESL